MRDDIGFEHLHRHSEFSLLDGYAKVEEYVARSPQVNQKFLCVTDHGMMAAVPRQIRCCDEMAAGEFKSLGGEKLPAYGLSPIFGCELYVQDKHVDAEERKLLSPDEMREQRKSYHLLAIAHSLQGYTNLIQLSSLGWLSGFYYKPRVTHEQLLKHREGITFSSCCYIGEIGQAFDRGGSDAAEEKLRLYMDMFGENFYLELMLLDFHKQKPYDEWLIWAHDKYHVPLIISGDCHYCNQEDSKYQRYMLMIQKGTTIKDIERQQQEDEAGEIFVNQDQNLWMKSEREMNEKWAQMYADVIPLELFEEAKRNTVRICEKAKGVEIDRESKLPQIPDEKEKFAELLWRGMKWRGVNNKKSYQNRLYEEMELICRKGFASYFLIQKMFVDEARRKCPEYLGWGTGHEAVGPGRGCLSGDTNVLLAGGIVKPIKHVVPGEVVATRDGSLQQVSKVHVYDNAEELVEIITCREGDDGARLTPDHMVWRKSESGEMEWVAAGEIVVGDLLWLPSGPVKVKSVGRAPSDGKVYDLSVPADETFLTTSFAVHNSGVGSLCNYVLGITDVDPIKHGLLFSRFLSEARGGKTMKTKFTQPPISLD